MAYIHNHEQFLKIYYFKFKNIISIKTVDFINWSFLVKIDSIYSF